MKDFLDNKVLPIASKIQNNTYVSAVSDGFAMVMPAILMGAIFTLLTSLQLGPYQDFIQAIKLKTIFGYAASVTTDMLAVYTVMAISYQLTIKKGFHKDAMVVAFVSLIMFMLLIPFGASGEAEVSKEVVKLSNVIPTEYLGSKGLFTGIIVAFVVPTIYLLLMKTGITIKMPDSVPATISKSFSALVPSFAVLLIFSVLRFLFTFTPYGDVNSFVYKTIAQPLNQLGSSPFSMLALILVAQLLWCVGIHGYQVIRPFLQVIYLPLSLENLAAYEAGLALPHAITYQHYGTYMNLGGSGGLLGLAILMAFFAKSKRYKALGRVGLPSTICSINEPLIFGTPVVLNPVMMIPFIAMPVISFVLPYTLQMIGILPTLRGISLPLGTPAIMYGFLSGGWPIALMQIILIALQVVIYYPFFKVADKQAIADEQEVS